MGIGVRRIIVVVGMRICIVIGVVVVMRHILMVIRMRVGVRILMPIIPMTISVNILIGSITVGFGYIEVVGVGNIQMLSIPVGISVRNILIVVGMAVPMGIIVNIPVIIIVGIYMAGFIRVVGVGGVGM